MIELLLLIIDDGDRDVFAECSQLSLSGFSNHRYHDS